MSKLETITIDTPSGSSALQIGDGNTATIGLGKSGDTLTVPSGATLSIAGTIDASSGTATGLGGANTPAFLARLSSTSQSIPNDTYTKIQFNTEEYDTANAYDNSGNYRFTVPSGQGGKYYIYSAVRMASSSATLTLNLRLNGSNAGFSSVKAVSGELHTILLTFSKSLSAGDYLEVYLRQQSGGSLDASGDTNDQTTYFGGFKLIE